MGDSEPIVTLRDMYEVLIGTRDDVRDLKATSGGTADQVDDHETRIRTVEANQASFVTEEDLRDRSNHGLTRASVVAGIVATILSLAEFLILHH
jgi:hypothetical protein